MKSKLTCCSVVWGVSCSSRLAAPPQGCSGPASRRFSPQEHSADSSVSSLYDPEEPELINLGDRHKEVSFHINYQTIPFIANPLKLVANHGFCI